VGITALPVIMIQEIESKRLFYALSIESAAGEKKEKKKKMMIMMIMTTKTTTTYCCVVWETLTLLQIWSIDCSEASSGQCPLVLLVKIG
jgi:CRISPR/Cas system-associated protein Cas7 (RAMP superfamily)